MDLSAPTDLAPSVGSAAALPCSQHSGAVVVRAFVKDMRAFLAEENVIKCDEIVARQLV
jgi:hypothetical protein